MYDNVVNLDAKGDRRVRQPEDPNVRRGRRTALHPRRYYEHPLGVVLRRGGRTRIGSRKFGGGTAPTSSPSAKRVATSFFTQSVLRASLQASGDQLLYGEIIGRFSRARCGGPFMGGLAATEWLEATPLMRPFVAGMQADRARLSESG